MLALPLAKGNVLECSRRVAVPFHSPRFASSSSLHFLKAPKTRQRTPAALSDSYTGPYIISPRFADDIITSPEANLSGFTG